MSNWKPRAAAALAPVIMLLPWLDKALQVDDGVFVWVAQQIAKHPFDFFGFDVNVGWGVLPIHTLNHNPPVVSYVLALPGALFNWSEVALHGALLGFAALAGLGIYELARDFAKRPFPVALLVILTPGFLVSASTLMTDAPLMAVYVWAIVAWRRAFTTADRRWFWVAMAAAAAAPLVKYYGVTVWPLLLVYAAAAPIRPPRWWVFLAAPVAVFAAFQAYVALRYSTAFADAASVALDTKWRAEETGFTRPFLTLVFLGGTALPVALLAARGATRYVALTVLIVTVLVSLPMIGGYSVVQLLVGDTAQSNVSTRIHFFVFLLAGALVLAAALRQSLRAGTRADTALLACWIGGTLVFTAFVNHYVCVRTILPMLPAVGVMALRDVPWRRWEYAALPAAAALSFIVLLGDDAVAEHDRAVAREALQRAEDDGATLRYVAFWGLEYYLAAGGAVPLGIADGAPGAAPVLDVAPGDRIVIDSYARTAWQTGPKGFVARPAIEKPYGVGVTTFDLHANAGFYSHRIGWLPYVFGYAPPERYPVYDWVKEPAE